MFDRSTSKYYFSDGKSKRLITEDAFRVYHLDRYVAENLSAEAISKYSTGADLTGNNSPAAVLEDIKPGVMDGHGIPIDLIEEASVASFIRNRESGAIYIFMEGKLHHILDYVTYTNVFGHPHYLVTEFTPSAIRANYTIGDPIPVSTQLLLDTNNGKMYFAEGVNKRKRLIMGDAFKKYHFNESAVIKATAKQLKAYPTGPDLK